MASSHASAHVQFIDCADATGTSTTAAVTIEWKVTVLKTDIWRVKTLKIGDTVVKE